MVCNDRFVHNEIYAILVDGKISLYQYSGFRHDVDMHMFRDLKYCTSKLIMYFPEENFSCGEVQIEHKPLLSVFYI
jgi:hypothetical protein